MQKTSAQEALNSFRYKTAAPAWLKNAPDDVFNLIGNIRKRYRGNVIREDNFQGLGIPTEHLKEMRQASKWSDMSADTLEKAVENLTPEGQTYMRRLIGSGRTNPLIAPNFSPPMGRFARPWPGVTDNPRSTKLLRKLLMLEEL